MAWRWVESEGKQSLHIGDSAFPLGTLDRRAQEELSNQLEIRAAVWAILYSARQSFAVGTADYEDAVANLTHIVSELFKAARQLGDTCDMIATIVAMSSLDVLPTVQERILLAKEILRRVAEKTT